MKYLSKTIITLAGMTGLRLDLGNIFLRIALLILGTCIFWAPIFLLIESTPMRGIVGAIVAWFYYYGGMSITFKTSLSRKWIQYAGEEGAYKMLTVLVGLGFFNQALAQTILVSSFQDTLNLGLPPLLIKGIGVVFIVVGLTTKLWATLLTGLDTYYYKDLFVDHVIRHENSDEGYITTGPYRYFENPMYGLGNFQAYGAALVGLSLQGLIVAAIYQGTIYLFYYLIEKPFFVRAYMNNLEINGD